MTEARHGVLHAAIARTGESAAIREAARDDVLAARPNSNWPGPRAGVAATWGRRGASSITAAGLAADGGYTAARGETGT